MSKGKRVSARYGTVLEHPSYDLRYMVVGASRVGEDSFIAVVVYDRSPTHGGVVTNMPPGELRWIGVENWKVIGG